MDPNEKKPSSEAKQEWMEHVSALSFSPLQSVVVEAKASKGLLKVEGYSLGRRGMILKAMGSVKGQYLSSLTI